MKKYYRVTEVIAGTQSEEKRKALLKWQKTLEKNLGIENANQERQDILNKGTETHKLIEEHLLAKSPTIHPTIAHLNPLLNLIIYSSKELKIEQRYWDNNHRITGQIDCSFVNEEEEQTILDWTTTRSFKRRQWVEDKFVQMGGYCLLFPKKVDLLTCVAIREHSFQIFEETDVVKYQSLFMERLQRFLQSKIKEEGKEIKVFDF